MVAFNSDVSVFVIDNYISVKDASLYSGYSQQYLRRLLRNNRLENIKIGQVWLINKKCLDGYIKMVNETQDRRFGMRPTYTSNSKSREIPN